MNKRTENNCKDRLLGCALFCNLFLDLAKKKSSLNVPATEPHDYVKRFGFSRLFVKIRLNKKLYYSHVCAFPVLYISAIIFKCPSPDMLLFGISHVTPPGETEYSYRGLRRSTRNRDQSFPYAVASKVVTMPNSNNYFRNIFSAHNCNGNFKAIYLPGFLI